MNMKPLWAVALAGILSVGVSACEKKGPLEQTGEEVDEALDTMKRGGDESTENKVDDAMDEARDAGEELTEE
ncbi:MAG: hypothetical protein ACREV5_17760 [Steroidobacter sp.]